MGQIGKRMLLLLFSFTLLVMQSFALERHATTTVKAAGRGQDDGEAGNEQANGQTDAHETTATPVQNRDETGGSAGPGPSGTTAKTGDSRGNNNNKYNPESGTNATERSGESVTPSETPRQSGNQDEVNSTQTNSAQGEGVRGFSDQEDPRDPHDGQKGTERPSKNTSHHEAGGGAQNNGQGDAAARAMTTPNNNGDGNEENRKEDVRTEPTGQEEETGKEGNDGDRTTRRPEENYQSHGKRVTTTVATDERDPSSQGDKTAKEDGEVTQSRHEENEEHAQTTPKINMNERHQSSAPSDQGQTDDAKTTNQPNKNEKRATEEPPSENKDQAMTTPRTATGQMPQTEKPQEREDTEYARTTDQNTDVHEMGERKATVRPSEEGSGDDDNAKGTQTERPQDQRDSRHVKTTQQSVFVSMGEKGKPTDSPRGEEDGGDNERHTLSDQSSQTENPHDQENNQGEDMVTDRANAEGAGGHGKGTPADETESKEERPVRTTPKRADAIREEEKKVTERPNEEGAGGHGKGTPADETESNEERQVTGRTQGDGIKPTPKGGEENSTTVYRLPRLVLAETQFTLSDDEKCTPFTLTFNIPQPQGGGKQTQPPGTDEDEEEEEEEEESGTDGDSETTTVISYEDFSALRMAQFSLPTLPFVLGAQDSKVLQGKTKRFKIDSTSFESDDQLMIEGRFCDMKSRILELCLSFNGHTRIRTRDAPEGKCHNITVYSDAPALSSARLSDAGDSVVIFFNKGVSAGKELRECSAIFDDATLELFGENAQCQWRSGNLELVVRLGKSSTIATGSQITLRDDRIRAFKERFSHTASGSFDVHAPNKPVTPSALIDGEPKVPDCGSVKLSALRSEGGGSRGLTYTWSLESPTENVDGGITKLLRKANNDNKAVLVIPASLLPEVTPFEWGLTVMNVLDREDFTTFTVRKANAREPNFEIRTNGIPKKGAVKITSAVSLVGDISFNRPGCPKETASEVQFQWSISGAEFEEGVLTTDKRILKFPRRSLPADADIEANLTVTYGTEDVMTLTRTVTFTTANEPLVARIKGGERTTTGVASDEFTLDCSLSRDPNYQGDGPDEGLNFEWGCWQETDKENCYYNDPEGETIQLPTTDQGSDGPILTVVPSTLTAGKVYSFSCYVGKEMEEKHDSVTIEVTENNPPRISLSLIKSKNTAYRPGRDVEIRAVVDGDDISEMTWEDIGGGLDGFGEDALTLIQDTTVDEEEETTLTTSEDADTDKPYTITISKKMGKYIVLLRINKDQLQAGSEYEMQFSALNGEELGSSTIGFEVGAKVTGCQFEFGGNDSYVDTATDVTYAVEACASEGEETLNYQAFASFPVDGKKPQMKFLGRTSEYPEIEVDHEVFDRIKRKVEAEEEVSFQVGMRVCYQDTRVCSVFKKDVTYVHQALTDEEVVAKKEEINDLKKEGKSVEALKAANSVQNARADQTVEGERKRRATVSFDTELLGLQKELLLLATGDSSNFDGYPGDIQSMADAAIDVPIEAFQREEMREILEADKNVLEAAKDLDDPLPQDTLDGIRQHLEDAKMAFTDTKFFTENREILGLLSKCMSKNLATGERVTSYGDDILITIEATLNIDPISIPMGDGDISFNGGDDVRNRYDASWEGCGCEECVGVLVEFFIYRGQDYVAGESHDSDVIGLRFISPCTGEAMAVEDLIDPITMSVPFTSPLLNTTNPICSFYNESLMTWSQRGVATRVHGMDVVCETNHTTEYVIDFTDEDGAMAEPTTTMTWGGEVSTRDRSDDDDDDEDDDSNIPGLNGLLGLGIGVIAGIVVASLVVLAVIIILLAVVIKNMNKPKVIVEPVIDIKA